MAISTYSELADNLASYSDRDLTPFLSTFVSLATAALNYGSEAVTNPLRIREMMKVSTLTTLTSVYTLPDDYLQYRRVILASGGRRPLSYITPDMSDYLYGDRPAGMANTFTLIGNDLYAFPGSYSNIELTYYSAIPEISSGADTNWLLTKYPHLYLQASLLELYKFVKDAKSAGECAVMVNSIIDAMGRKDQLSEFANAPMRFHGWPPGTAGRGGASANEVPDGYEILVNQGETLVGEGD